jgi:hypothetical protein
MDLSNVRLCSRRISDGVFFFWNNDHMVVIYDDIDQNFSTNENNNEQKERARLYTAERIMNEEFR